jgi:hypothetical protein
MKSNLLMPLMKAHKNNNNNKVEKVLQMSKRAKIWIRFPIAQIYQSIILNKKTNSANKL